MRNWRPITVETKHDERKCFLNRGLVVEVLSTPGASLLLLSALVFQYSCIALPLHICSPFSWFRIDNPANDNIPMDEDFQKNFHPLKHWQLLPHGRRIRELPFASSTLQHDSINYRVHIATQLVSCAPFKRSNEQDLLSLIREVDTLDPLPTLYVSPSSHYAWIRR